MFDAVDVDPETVVRSALPFLGGELHDPTAAGRDRAFTVTFVAQSSVPSTREERRHALGQAATHAALHPERQVIVKLRGRLGEQTTHVERHHYATLLPVEEIPPNLEIVYGQMSDVLDRTDSASRSVRPLLSRRCTATSRLRCSPIFGVREALGNHAFLHSGALTSWRMLHDGEIPKTDPAWAADNGVSDIAPYDRVQARLAALAADRSALPPLRPWFVPEDAAGYLPRLLARNGLDIDGSPLLTNPAWSRAHPGPGRRAMRATARKMYRVSVRKLEPRLRRWAQL